MSAKNSAEINVGFPIYGVKFLNSKTILAVGGGGEGNNGIPNKITAIRCSFNVPDKNRRLQKFREITLPANEDSPMCVDVAHVSDSDGVKHSIFVGCNQSTELLKLMSVNNNLRKYVYTDEEHLRFLDAVQFENSILPDSVGEYPKIIHLSPENALGAMMTSKASEIYVFNPDALELGLKVKSAAEIKDFHLSQHDSGKTLCLVTASTVEAYSTGSGSLISSSANADKSSIKTLAKYFLSKVRFVGDSKVVITAASRKGKGAVILEYDLTAQKVTKEKLLSKKIKGLVAIDVCKAQNLIGVAGNDNSVSLVRLSDLAVLKTINKLHDFAITSLSFAPGGKKLASGSASNTLNVLTIPPKLASGRSLIGALFRYLFLTILVAGLAMFVQQAHENGQLDQYADLSRKFGGDALVRAQGYGGDALVRAQEYGKISLEYSQKYGNEYFVKAQHYGKIGYDVLKEKSLVGYELIKEKLNRDNLDEDNANQYFTMSEWTETQTTDGSNIQKTLNDIVSQVTKNVDHLTANALDIDTESIIKEAVDHLTIVAGTAQSYASAVGEAASVVAEKYEDVAEKVQEVVEPIAEAQPVSELKLHALVVADVAQLKVSEVVEIPEVEVVEPVEPVELLTLDIAGETDIVEPVQLLTLKIAESIPEVDVVEPAQLLTLVVAEAIPEVTFEGLEAVDGQAIFLEIAEVIPDPSEVVESVEALTLDIAIPHKSEVVESVTLQIVEAIPEVSSFIETVADQNSNVIVKDQIVDRDEEYVDPSKSVIAEVVQPEVDTPVQETEEVALAVPIEPEAPTVEEETEPIADTAVGSTSTEVDSEEIIQAEPMLISDAKEPIETAEVLSVAEPVYSVASSGVKLEETLKESAIDTEKLAQTSLAEPVMNELHDEL